MARAYSPWALHLGNIRNIPIRIHVTFFLLPLWVGFDEASRGGSPLHEVLFVLLLFACVLLHELGHALMARRFGIATRDIVLYPFGGIATLMGDARPHAEFLIAIAGPAVNLLIALILFPFIIAGGPEAYLADTAMMSRVFVANVVLALFNLIPAIPMDGGRILRALLAMAGVSRATAIASRISQVLSIGVGILGLVSGNPFLIVIGILVFNAAMQEVARSRTSRAVSGRVVSDVMIPASRLETFSHGTTVPSAVQRSLKSFQPWYPVMYQAELLGLISKEDLLRATVSDEEEQYVSSLMEREPLRIDEDAPLSLALDRFSNGSQTPLVVMRSGEFSGLLFQDSLLDLVLVDESRDYYRSADRGDD